MILAVSVEVIVVVRCAIVASVARDITDDGDADDDDDDDDDGGDDDCDDDGDGGNEIDEVVGFRELWLCICEQSSATTPSSSSSSLSLPLSCKSCSISICRSAIKRSFTSISRDVCKHICKQFSKFHSLETEMKTAKMANNKRELY